MKRAGWGNLTNAKGFSMSKTIRQMRRRAGYDPCARFLANEATVGTASKLYEELFGNWVAGFGLKTESL